jgi:acetylornithine deacetylase/succinyl-diaminopimelate desuccinylase-like protein
MLTTRAVSVGTVWPLRGSSGGTEPVVGLLARILQRPAYMMGLGGAGEHGPNEHLLVEEAAGAMATVARLLGSIPAGIWR